MRPVNKLVIPSPIMQHTPITTASLIWSWVHTGLRCLDHMVRLQCNQCQCYARESERSCWPRGKPIHT